LGSKNLSAFLFVLNDEVIFNNNDNIKDNNTDNNKKKSKKNALHSNARRFFKHSTTA